MIMCILCNGSSILTESISDTEPNSDIIPMHFYCQCEIGQCVYSTQFFPSDLVIIVRRGLGLGQCEDTTRRKCCVVSLFCSQSFSLVTVFNISPFVATQVTTVILSYNVKTDKMKAFLVFNLITEI